MYGEWSEGIGKGVWRGGGVIKKKKKKKVDLKLWGVYISGEEWICPVHRKSRNILKYILLVCLFLVLLIAFLSI